MAKNKKAPSLGEEPEYKYRQAFFMSFYSRQLYVDVAKRWRGYGLIYLFLTIALLCIPMYFKVTADYDKSFQKRFVTPIATLPVMDLRNGHFLFSKTMPYLVKDSEGNVVLAVDTAADLNYFNKYPKLSTLINNEGITFKNPMPDFLIPMENMGSKSILTQPFDTQYHQIFDGRDIAKSPLMLHLKQLTQFMIYPYSLFFIYFMSLPLLLVLAFLGPLLARAFFSMHISFKQSSRLLMVAATPMYTVLVTMVAMQWVHASFAMMFLIIIAAYYAYALLSLKMDSRKMVVA